MRGDRVGGEGSEVGLRERGKGGWRKVERVIKR